MKKRVNLIKCKSLLGMSALTLLLSMNFTRLAYADSFCAPGFFGPEDSFECEAAPPGFYVPNAGATSPTITPAGTYTFEFASIAPILAPPGSFVSSEGQTSAELSPAGYFVPNSGATAPTISPAGSYVPNEGAIAAVLASPGTFVADEGQISANLAPAGFFVPVAGATSATISPAGSYVPNEGAIAAILAPPGTFVADEGQTSANLAPAGFFVPVSGATSATISPAGSYVPNEGAIAAILASPGTFVANEGQTSAELAQPGFFVSESGATFATIAPVGFFTADAGATQAIPAAPGFYAPEEGSTFTLICPQDSTSFGAAPACRSGFISMNNPDTISPDFNSNYGLGGQFNLGAVETNTVGVLEFDVTNVANALGYTDDLTSLSLIDASFSGNNADLFSLEGFMPLSVLGEQESLSFSILFLSMLETSFNVDLRFTTDQFATFGGAGQEFVFNFIGRFRNGEVEVPAPAMSVTALLLASLIFRKRFIRNAKKA